MVLECETPLGLRYKLCWIMFQKLLQFVINGLIAE